MIKKKVLILYHKDYHIIAKKRSELRSLIICMYLVGFILHSHLSPKNICVYSLSDHPYFFAANPKFFLVSGFPCYIFFHLI